MRRTLALLLALGVEVGCRRPEPPAVEVAAVTAPIRVAPVAMDHPWVLALVTDIADERPRGVHAWIDDWRTPERRSFPDPVIEAEDPGSFGRFLREYERLHPRPLELVPVWEHQISVIEGQPPWRVHFIDEQAGFVIDGGATASIVESYGELRVRIELSPTQGQQLAALTRARVGRRIAFTLDDQVVNSPFIREAVTGGQVMLVPEAPGADPKLVAKALLERLSQAE